MKTTVANLSFRTILWLLITLPLASTAQSRSTQLIQVLVSPDQADWTYDLGEEAVFTITVLKNQVPLENAEVSYTIGPEKMPATESATLQLDEGTGKTGKVTMESPGFLRCEAKITVDGQEYRGIATAGYEPTSIAPTQSLPDDFDEFWNTAKTEAAKVPLDAHLTLLPERCTETVDVYELNIQNYEPGARLYGILAKPKGEGKYPAVLRVPGAGIRPYAGAVSLAEKGIITLEIGIHGVSVTQNPDLYQNLAGGALKNYWMFNLDDRDKYYYKRVYLGCVRAIDYLYAMDEFDGDNLLVWGGSQGGALSIITASLDDRVKGLVSLYPALSDLTGYLHGRAGGWPHMFNESNAPFMAKEEKIAVSAYYDVVNFARTVNVPGFYTWGYNDETCPPTSFYAAFNQIEAPKEVYLVQETGHWTFPEQQQKIEEWILGQLGK